MLAIHAHASSNRDHLKRLRRIALNKQEASLRPAHELRLGDDNARRAFGALVSHLETHYRYFPSFARLQDEALVEALVAKAETLCLEFLRPPPRLAALSAYGWGRMDRWIRAQLSDEAPIEEPTQDEHEGHRANHDLVMALAVDHQDRLRGGVPATPRDLPPGLEDTLALLPEEFAPKPAQGQIWIATAPGTLAVGVVVIDIGETISACLTHDTPAVAADDEIFVASAKTGFGESLVIAPWCHVTLRREQLESYVTTVSAPLLVDLPNAPGTPSQTSKAQTQLREMLQGLASSITSAT